MRRVWMVAGAPPDAGDGVGDFAAGLATEMARTRLVTLVVPGGRPGAGSGAGFAPSTRARDVGWTMATARELLSAAGPAAGDAAIVHFVPHLYGWLGTNPMIAQILIRLRRRACRIVTIVHELGVPFGGSLARTTLAMSQRLLLRLVVAASDRMVVTTELAGRRLGEWFPARRKDVRRIPVSSTIPVVGLSRERRAAMRAQIGVEGANLLLAVFASPFADVAMRTVKLLGWFESAGVRVRPLVLGKLGAQFLDRLEDSGRRNKAVALGPASADVLAAWLASADLYAVFYLDGASTRRTSLMAGLSHALPVLTNRGELTEPSLAACEGLCFLGDDEVRAVEVVHELGTREEVRRQRGAAGREWYERHCGWDVVRTAYEALLDELAGVDPGREG